jgi:hypothetical protein
VGMMEGVSVVHLTCRLATPCRADQHGDLMSVDRVEERQTLSIDGEEQLLLLKGQVLSSVVRDEAIETETTTLTPTLNPSGRLDCLI